MKSPPIVIGHGWGLSALRFQELADLLTQRGYVVYTLDYPGFGEEPLEKIFTIPDYVSFLVSFLRKKSIVSCIYIGHSFGGRVGIVAASEFPQMFTALILTGAPGYSPTLSLKRRIGKILASAVKPIVGRRRRDTISFPERVLYRLLGVSDFLRAKSWELRETFKNVVSYDLDEAMGKIAVPTLLLWGKLDTMIPLSIAVRMQHRISNSQLVIIDDIGHNLPYKDPQRFAQAVDSFIKSL